MTGNGNQVNLSLKTCFEKLVKSLQVNSPYKSIEEGTLETKTDCSGKDQLFFACVVFWVITFEPTMI